MDHSLEDQERNLDSLMSDWVWLGELARRIVRDSDLADDARQAAWLSESTGDAEHSVHGPHERRRRLYWAVRQFASNTRAAERRRVHREQIAAQAEALPSTEALVHRGEQRQRVWKALTELPEPLRGTLLFHFQESLSPVEIAARSGAKADTVRRRIQRGVQELRKRLDADREGGGVLALAAAFPRSIAEVAGATSLTSTSVFGLLSGATLLMKGLTAMAIAAVLFLAGRAWLVSAEPHESEEFSVPISSVDSIGAARPRADAELPAARSDFDVGSREALAMEAPAVEDQHPTATWSGSVLVHDAEGTLLPGETTCFLDATISIPMTPGQHLSPSSSIQSRLPIVAGRFEISLSQDDSGVWGYEDSDGLSRNLPKNASITDAVLQLLGGTSDALGPLVLMSSATSPIVRPNRQIPYGEENVEVSVRPIAPVVLSVLDSRNVAIHLEDIDVHAVNGVTDRVEIQGSRSRPELASSKASPVTLTPPRRLASQQSTGCVIHSPGFAHKHIQLDLSTGGTRTVTLGPGGDLSVVVQGEVPEETFLRVYIDEERWAPFANLHVRRAKEFELTGLPLGEAQVRLEKGSFFRDPIVLAEEDVVIQSGSRASALLVPKRLGIPAPVEVHGTLTVPKSWELENSSLSFRRTSSSMGSDHEGDYLRVSELKREATTVIQYEFSAGPLIPGDYCVTLDTIAYSTAFTVPEGGLQHLRIDVPAPAAISVTVRDSATGGIAEEIGSMSWKPVFEGRGGFLALPSAQRNGSSQSFEFEVPTGPVRLSVGGKEYAHTSQVIQAVDGLTVDMVVTRVARATAEFQHDGRHVPWPDEFQWDGAILSLGHEGERLSRGTTRAGIQFRVTQPGSYRLTPPKVEGFQAVDPVDITLTVGKPLRIVLELKPE